MIKEDKSILKLNKESNEQFNKCIDILEYDNDKETKYIFYYFLYNDIFIINTDNNYKNYINISDIINNPATEIIKNLNNIYLNIDKNIFNEFKIKLIRKIDMIKKKVDECDNHIEIIIKEYKNIVTNTLLPSNDNTKLLFNNKTVLNMNKKSEYNIQLSEFFVRFIFTLIKNTENNNLSSLESKIFYKNIESDINKIIENKPFRIISNNFKYWFILIFLIKELFSSNNKYSIIFNNNEFNSLLNNILKQKNEKNKEKKEKKKKKKKGKKKNIKKKKKKKNKKKKKKRKKKKKKKKKKK